MARKTTATPQDAPAKAAGTDDLPTYAFERFRWTPVDLPHGATVPARELCQLVEHVIDVASGAALVFELMSDHEQDIESFNSAYLSPFHLGQLRRLATRSLESLDEKAGEIVNRLHKLARGET